MTAPRLAVFGAIAAAMLAPTQALAQFADQLVQAPKLTAPERGSVQGAMSGERFTATELARGAFRLPLSIATPDDRGPLQASVIPAYSPDGGISEWGMGWGVELSIKRHRLLGEIDFAHDELVSPWGRLRSGNDGKLYPSGMSAPVRITSDGADWIATSSDGTRYRFSAASGITTARGVYSWQLTEVINLEGDRTTLVWIKNASGRPFLDRVTWGGRTGAPQYELKPTYETLATAFIDHTTGAALDRRINRVTVSVRDPGNGALRERWHYELAYRAAPFGPAFYLERAQRTFASGDVQPAMVYRYELDDTRLPGTPLEHYTGLDAVLGALGDTAVQPDRATLQDVDPDGVPDFEYAANLTQIQHTATGWVQRALPAATGTDPRCRPGTSDDNHPRVLARMNADVGAPHVVYTQLQSAEPETTEVLVCDRLGHPVTDVVVPGNWELGPTVRLVDVDRDRRPDLVRVSSVGLEILHNDSDSRTIRFSTRPRFEWTLDFEPRVTWLNDLDGDGNVDVTVRTADGLWVLFGLGGGRWTTAPVLFPLLTLADGMLGRVNTYQMSFVDANKDGLADIVLSKGTGVWLYTNRGDSFGEVPVDAFRKVESEFGLPIVADLTGAGNTQVVFPTLGTAYVVELALPSTGLLASADDGAGTVLKFHYSRSTPSVRTEQRVTVLDRLTVESSGYDAVSYSYDYGVPVLHTSSKHLVGFASVTKHSPQLTEQVTFLNDDDVSGITNLSTDTDDRSPGIVRFSQHAYDDIRAHAVRWLRPSRVDSGYRNPAGNVQLATTTRYLAYERDVCPTVVSTESPSGTLLTTTALTSIAAMPDDLHCLSGTQRLIGTHADPGRDFNYLLELTRNSLGQVTQVTQYSPTMASIVLQQVAYRSDHRISSVTSPGRGTASVDYDAVGRMSSSTDPVGVVSQIGELDPITDLPRSVQTLRPDAPTTSYFRHDGRDRLQKLWDDVSGASETRPRAAYSYRDPTATTPGRIDTHALADAMTGTTRYEVALVAADGAAMATATWQGDRFAVGAIHTTTRTTLTSKAAFLATLTDAALTAITSADLRAQGTALSETIAAGIGHTIQATTTYQQGIAGTVTTELLLDGSELISRVHQPGGFIAESAVDAAGKLVRKTDETGVDSRYEYDALGRLVRLATPDGAHVLAFDGFGRPGRVSRDGIGAIVYAYDPVSGLATQRRQLDATGAVLDTAETHYDAIGRPTFRFDSTPTATAQIGFDHDGVLGDTTVAGQLGRLSHVYGDGWERSELFDPLGRAYHQELAIAGWRTVSCDKTYRPDGSVASDTLTITNPAGAIVFTSTRETELDAQGRLHAVKLNGSVLYTVSYDPEGRIAHADFTSGQSVTFDYDPTTHRERGYQLAAGPTSGATRWSFDARGLISDETFTRGTTPTRRDYGYDGRGALISATTAGVAATYDYTDSGLPSQIVDSAGTRSVHRTGTTLTVGGVAYTWDQGGRVVGKGPWTFAYGPSGQLEHAHRTGRDVDFVYDEASARLFKKVNGLPVRAEVAGGVLTSDHFIELLSVGGVAVGVLDNGLFKPLLTDPRGTPFVDNVGATNLASPYGVRDAPLGFAETVDYARLGWDPDLDLVRMGVRDYDAKLSQFTTPDPLYLESLERCQTSPLQCSLYGYASDNPISFTDPTGMEGPVTDPLPFTYTPRPAVPAAQPAPAAVAETATAARVLITPAAAGAAAFLGVLFYPSTAGGPGDVPDRAKPGTDDDEDAKRRPKPVVNLDTGAVVNATTTQGHYAVSMLLYLRDKDRVITRAAFDEFIKGSFSHAGQLERIAFYIFMAKTKFVANDPSERVKALTPNSNKSAKALGDVDKIVFGTSDKNGWTTVTTDSRFANAAANRGVKLNYRLFDSGSYLGN
jgi:RHS repeat-associated protein